MGEGRTGPAGSPSWAIRHVLAVPPVGTIHVAPTNTGLMFVPNFRTYANVTTSVSGQNYLAIAVAPALTTRVQTNAFILGWYGFTGVTYQTLYSTNLVDWVRYGPQFPGNNGPLQLTVPLSTAPTLFFRMGASY